MIKLYELSESTKSWLSAMNDEEIAHVLDMATSLMLEIEMKRQRVRLGENGCVELVLKVILYLDGKGNCDG